MMENRAVVKKLTGFGLLLVAFTAWMPVSLSAQQVEYYHLDALGSVRAVTSASGAILVRHDYEPYGREWNAPSSTDSRRFTGKERDSESGMDYFGARYLSTPVARFTSIDPVAGGKAAVNDPQRWNRYAYARDNPLFYVDPTGAVLELTGTETERQRAFDIFKDIAGPRGSKLLYTTNAGGRTFVEYSGREHHSLDATGQIGVYLADIIDSAKTTEFTFATTFEDKEGGHNTAYFGGAATVGMEESLNGNVQIFMHPDAASIMSGISQSILGRARSSDGRPLAYTTSLIAAHELGHAWANLKGSPLYLSNATNASALDVENLMRARLGLPNRRVIH